MQVLQTKDFGNTQNQITYIWLKKDRISRNNKWVQERCNLVPMLSIFNLGLALEVVVQVQIKLILKIRNKE